jgi:8-oxo-dGTP pyrophosphatase MutT (NUDIX family)
MEKEIFKSAVHMIIVKDDKILLQKRKGCKLWPGYYALPAGHIDKGENQYDALIREAQEELGINIDPKNIINSYVILRRNYFEIDGKKLEPYIDYYFEIHDYNGIPKIIEENKCEELIWSDIDDLPEPFINYEGAFLEDRTISTYDCKIDGPYVKKIKL